MSNARAPVSLRIFLELGYPATEATGMNPDGAAIVDVPEVIMVLAGSPVVVVVVDVVETVDVVLTVEVEVKKLVIVPRVLVEVTVKTGVIYDVDVEVTGVTVLVKRYEVVRAV